MDEPICPNQDLHLIPAERMPFPEEWNMKLVVWFPGAVPDLEGWVRQVASTSSYAERSCLGDIVAIRLPPPGEEEIPKTSKKKKRKRGSPANSPKPMKSKAQKTKADTVALSPEMAQRLRDEDEEGEDDDCLLIVRKRGSAHASKTAEPMVVDAVHSRTEDISEGSSSKVPEPSSKRAPRVGGFLEGEIEGLGSESLKREENVPSGYFRVINVVESLPGPEFSDGQFRDARNMRFPDVGTIHEGNDSELKKLVEERDGLKHLYILKEEEIRDLRVELVKAHREQAELVEKAQQKGELVEQLCEELKMKNAETLGRKQCMDRLASLQSVKEESLARSCKIEELEAKFVDQLAKAKSDAEAFVSSYRADAEAANIRAQEISTATEVKWSCGLDHARRQSRRETLEEVHARGFNLSADIEEAKTLEEEAAAFLSDNEDSTSGFESRGDEDEVSEREVPEDAALEDAAPEDVASRDVVLGDAAPK
ncbi:PREDICTED: uncharacterized protein LOC109206408 [Nicotiana attenuata]|uniref:uncharacterized protein LOC109206408 n=1 Tax=Nicotiana attenuata TaxID=49451 RepID=UPI0009059971|nr:PREDICTED: uncharacterized protein LOC109206408 [Nicotiana attenuata]